MNILEILKILMALFNIIFGVFAVYRPDIIATASQFSLNNARGRAEMRIAMGGFFIGMGLGALLLGSVISQENIAYQVVGFAWLGGGATRLFNLLLEKPSEIVDQTFWILLSTEIIPGIILILPN